MKRAVACMLALWVGSLGAQEPQPVETTYNLKPRYSLGGELEGEATLNLDLTVRIQVPSKGMDHRSLQAQEIVRSFRDRVVKVESGKVTGVTREYLDAHEMQRLPGSQTFNRIEDPLHGRSLTIGLSSDGKRVVRVEGDPSLPDQSTENELHTERYEAVLPHEPVAVGASWSCDTAALRRAVGNGFGRSPKGTLECRFVEVKDEVLDPELTPEAAPQSYAIVRVELETHGRMGSKPADPDMTCHLTGTLWFSLSEHKLAKVELEGRAHVKSVEREGDAEVTITAVGPLKVAKRFWFPKKPAVPSVDDGADSGLPTPPQREK